MLTDLLTRPAERHQTGETGRNDTAASALLSGLQRDAYISRATWSLAAQHRGPAATAAAGPSGGQSRSCSFTDEIAFELGQGGKHVENQLAAGVVVSIASCRLRNPTPRSARPVTVSTRWRQGAAEPVELPDDQGVAPAGVVEELLKGGTVSAGAASRLGEDAVAAGAPGRRPGGVGVGAGGGGDRGVAQQMSHRRRESWPARSSGPPHRPAPADHPPGHPAAPGPLPFHPPAARTARRPPTGLLSIAIPTRTAAAAAPASAPPKRQSSLRRCEVKPEAAGLPSLTIATGSSGNRWTASP
jgi:hypothetical protein